MTHSLGSLALDLLLTIHSKVAKEIPYVGQWTSADESKGVLEYILSYTVPETHDAFCVVSLSVSQFEPPEFFFEVLVDYKVHHWEDDEMYQTNTDGLLSQYVDLRPAVAKGFVNYLDADESGKTNFEKPTPKPSFNVQYKVFCDAIGEKEDYHNSCGFDEMANKILPYIKSLHEVFKVIHQDHKNLKGDMI